MQEEIVPKPTDGSALDASYRNYAGRTPFCILLGSQEDGQDDLQVAAPEVLLAVLEGLFVDDARIEYEGAPEVRPPPPRGTCNGTCVNTLHAMHAPRS